MSSVWTPIDEKALSTGLIKNENADDEENSSLSNASGTTSSSTNSRTSPRNSSQQNQQVTIYSEHPSSITPTTVTNINTVSSNDLQQEQYPSTNGKSLIRKTKIRTFFFFQESSSFSGQFQQQQGQLSYAESVAYYGDDLVNGVDHLQQHHHPQNYSHLQQRRNIFYLKFIYSSISFFIELYSPPTPSNHHQQSISPSRFTLHHTPQSQSDYRHSPYDEANRYVASTSTRRTSTSPNDTVYDNGAHQGWTSNEPQHYYGLPTAYAPSSVTNLNDLAFLQQSQLTNNTDQIQFWNDNPAAGSYIQCTGTLIYKRLIQ